MPTFVMSNVIGRSHLNTVASLTQQSNRIEQRLSTGDLAITNKEDGYLQATASRLNRQLDTFQYDIEKLRIEKRELDSSELSLRQAEDMIDRASSIAQTAKATSDLGERASLAKQATDLIDNAIKISGDTGAKRTADIPFYEGVQINNGATDDEFLVYQTITPFTGDFTFEMSFTSNRSSTAFTPYFLVKAPLRPS